MAHILHLHDYFHSRNLINIFWSHRVFTKLPCIGLQLTCNVKGWGCINTRLVGKGPIILFIMQLELHQLPRIYIMILDKAKHNSYYAHDKIMRNRITSIHDSYYMATSLHIVMIWKGIYIKSINSSHQFLISWK